MCTSCYPDDIIVCPLCKRDDEGFRLGESDSPFEHFGNGEVKCICGEIFSVKEDFHDLQKS